MGLLKTKTFWVALAAVCSAVGLAFGGEISWGEAVQMVVLGLLGITGRHALVKAQK